MSSIGSHEARTAVCSELTLTSTARCVGTRQELSLAGYFADDVEVWIVSSLSLEGDKKNHTSDAWAKLAQVMIMFLDFPFSPSTLAPVKWSLYVSRMHLPH